MLAPVRHHDESNRGGLHASGAGVHLRLVEVYTYITLR
jgi:hypothetical protein